MSYIIQIQKYLYNFDTSTKTVYSIIKYKNLYHNQM